MEKLEWSAPEYEEKERSNDWFWALGVIVVASSLAAIIFGNYFFAILLIISGLLMSFFAIKKPEMVNYELNQKGLKIKNRLFPYKNIKSFFLQDDPYITVNKMPTLFIKSQRMFMPIISIPVERHLAEKIKEKMLSMDVTEEKIEEHPSEKIMEYLGF